MKLAIFDDWRLGLVSPDEREIIDVTAALPDHNGDPFGAGWWVRLCRDLDQLRPALEKTAVDAEPRPLSEVRLRQPVLNPGKVVAAASNYAAHSAEMAEIIERTTPNSGDRQTKGKDVFLKAPSSIIGPGETIELPKNLVDEGREIHHESELVVVIGKAGAHIKADDAMAHVLGYTIGIDVTVRGAGDRSRRKSYDTFSPLGPWVTTADEVPDPQDLQIKLTIGDEVRQDVHTSTMDTSVRDLVVFASDAMRLEPGDVIFTGAPPGVGQIHDGDLLVTTISRLGELRLPVRTVAH